MHIYPKRYARICHLDLACWDSALRDGGIEVVCSCMRDGGSSASMLVGFMHKDVLTLFSHKAYVAPVIPCV